MRPHTVDEAAAVCDLVDRWQQTFLESVGRRMVFAADEYYLMAERPFPPAATYEGFPQHENGLGMARAFEAAFGGDEHAALGRAPRVLRRRRRCPGRRLPGAPHRPDGDADAGGPEPEGTTIRRSPSSPVSTVPWCSPRSSTRSGAATSAWSRWRTTSSAATSGSPAC